MDISTVLTPQPCEIRRSDVMVLEGHTSEVKYFINMFLVCLLFIFAFICCFHCKTLLTALFTVHLGVCLCMESYRISSSIRVGIFFVVDLIFSSICIYECVFYSCTLYCSTWIFIRYSSFLMKRC